MKKIFTLMFALVGCCGFVVAQDDEVNDTYQFISASGEVIIDGSTIVMQHVEKEEDPGTGEVTYKVPADFQVKNVSNTFGEAVRLCMNITKIDNGEFNTCALGNCIPPKSQPGEFYTSSQILDLGAASGDLLTEWYAFDYGKCVVEMQIEVGEIVGFGTFTFLEYGPKITVEFVNPDPAGIKEADSRAIVPVECYTLDGRIASHVQKGIQIVRYSDGSVRKSAVR
jgi:hypothetical protein